MTTSQEIAAGPPLKSRRQTALPSDADDARVKIKVAASQYPFQFVAIQRVKGEWVEERF
ncbi:hypothetical protein [Sphingopyxis sp. 113P3]|uniref:hypothetical protein n=1 Tax=Sphingopyxis sp. (strain 113P3) TaxID=292913 RepID=UPI001F2D2E53|nr:hypothetical protein [Sphingopyxis sp. 113P3]